VHCRVDLVTHMLAVYRYTEEQITEMERIARALNDKIRNMEAENASPADSDMENTDANGPRVDALPSTSLSTHTHSDAAQEASNRSVNLDPVSANKNQDSKANVRVTAPAPRKSPKDKDFSVDQSPEALAAAIFVVQVCYRRQHPCASTRSTQTCTCM
jgi:hypothetical protein